MAGQIKANQLQLGDSATATQNFTLQTNVDGTAKLARGNAGATTQDILTVNSAGVIKTPQNLVAFSAHTSGVTNMANNTTTIIAYATEDFDTTNSFASSTFTVPVAGYYWISGGCYFGAPLAAGATPTLGIYKNGSIQLQSSHSNNGTAYDITTVQGLLLCAVGDTIDIRGTQNTGVTINTVVNTAVKFQGHLLGAI